MPPTLTPVHVVDHVVLADGRNAHPGQKNVEVDLADPYNAALAEAGRILPTGPSAVAAFDPSTATDDELGGWVAKTNAPDVLVAVGDDRELAARVLAIEIAREQPRTTVVEPLQRLTESDQETVK